jgi:glutamine amidotransferase
VGQISAGISVAIIDCGSGNLRSAAKALAYARDAAGESGAVTVTREPETVLAADRVVLPGQGAFRACMAGLNDIPGMRAALEEAVRERAKPFLGICVGMQVMAQRGLEHGQTEGLGWIAGEVAPIEPGAAALKIPHMGWNELVDIRRDHPVLAAVPAAAHAYFVHSFAMRCRDSADRLAAVEYGAALPAIVGRDTMIGMQFHPEKSQALGLSLLSAFLRWRP